eukprot:TRINITY_DN36178_c0_g1_i1.p1 TRINITY_DN36178_c0_g1~~TRINITY_DN36178_c0_g1_i1.p1  ORF type:complete len:582 (+),score=198.21 TRINITY_DN36178_c0_g1_i1:96-1748(+)
MDSPFLESLMEYYQRHDPSKNRDDIIFMLKKYKGYEEDLFQGMMEIWGERPRWPPGVPPMAARLPREAKQPAPAGAAPAGNSQPPSPTRRQGAERRLWRHPDWPSGVPLTRQEWAEEGLTPEEWDAAPAEQLYNPSGGEPLPRAARVRIARLKAANAQEFGDFLCCRCALCGSLLRLLLDPDALQYQAQQQLLEEAQEEIRQLQGALSAAATARPRAPPLSPSAARAIADAGSTRMQIESLSAQLQAAENELRYLRGEAAASREKEREGQAGVAREAMRAAAAWTELQRHAPEMERLRRTLAASEEAKREAEAELREARERAQLQSRRLTDMQQRLAEAQKQASAERLRTAEHATAAAAARSELAHSQAALRQAAAELQQAKLDANLSAEQLSIERHRQVWDKGPLPMALPLAGSPPRNASPPPAEAAARRGQPAGASGPDLIPLHVLQGLPASPQPPRRGSPPPSAPSEGPPVVPQPQQESPDPALQSVLPPPGSPRRPPARVARPRAATARTVAEGGGGERRAQAGRVDPDLLRAAPETVARMRARLE